MARPPSLSICSMHLRTNKGTSSWSSASPGAPSRLGGSRSTKAAPAGTTADDLHFSAGTTIPVEELLAAERPEPLPFEPQDELEEALSPMPRIFGDFRPAVAPELAPAEP